VTDAAALALFLVNIKEAVVLAVDGAVGAIDIANAASDAPVFIPLREAFDAITRCEWLGNALINQRTLDHLLRKFGCRFQNRSPFLADLYESPNLVRLLGALSWDIP